MTNNIQVRITLDGTELSTFSSISIRQEFNAHHTFEVLVNHDVLEKFGTSSLDVSKKYIGKFISISFGEKDASENIFKGVVTEISMEQSRGAWANILLKGHSPTYLLEGYSHNASYYNKTLKSIVEDSLSNMLSNAMPFTVKPKFSGSIAYMCQYKESHFQFINRLAAEYGEWFYYDGEKLLFGKPSNQPKVNLNYGEDIEEMSLSLRVLPANITHFSYNSADDKVLTSPAPGQAEGANNYAKHALSVADSLYIKPVKQTPLIRTKDKEALDNYAKQQKSKQAAGTVMLKAKGNNPKVKLGGKAKISVVKKEGGKESIEEQGEYLVTSINHHITGTFKYTQLFEALPAVIEVLPVELSKPIAETQMAIVKDNADPQKTGRVRVQMLWQQEKGEMTDWIRVLTPDGGSSDKVSKNRGFVFIPEIGDQVFVGFRYNDPNRPFVLGSMFHGKVAGGGGDANKTKSLTTRSGSTFTLDDDKGNILVSDAKGNTMAMDGAGNISVNSSTTISLSIGKESISLITLDDKGNIVIKGKTIGIVGETSVNMGAGKDGADSGVAATTSSISVQSKNEVTVKGDMKTTMGGQNVTVSGDMMVNVSGPTVKLN